METRFWKIRGPTTAFAIFDARTTEVALPPERVQQLTGEGGIGCGQLIRLEASTGAGVFLRLFDSDGAEIPATDEALRGAASLIGPDIGIETSAGLVVAHADADGIALNRGRARHGWQDIPLAREMPTHPLPRRWHALPLPDVIDFAGPHVVFFVDDVEAVPLNLWGPEISADRIFPEGASVTIAAITGRDRMRLAMWHRPVGNRPGALMQMSGIMAGAAFAVARDRALVGTRAHVSMPAGELLLEEAVDVTIFTIGPAVSAVEGTTAL